MAVDTESRSSGRAKAGGSRQSSRSNGSAGSRGATRGRQANRNRSASAASGGSAATKGASKSRPKPASSSRAAGASRRTRQTAANANGQGVPDAVTRVAVPVVTAALGVAGGALLGRQALQRRRKVLGVPVPNAPKVDLAGVAQQVGEAGRQFARLAGEVRAVRDKAEQIGRALS